MNQRQPYQPKTGQPCHCKRGQQRDNCPDCEGTGQRIDFAAIQARPVRPRELPFPAMSTRTLETLARVAEQQLREEEQEIDY